MKVTALVTEIKPVQEIPSKTAGKPPTPKLLFSCNDGKEYNIFGKAELQKAVKLGENISMEVEEKEWKPGFWDRKVIAVDGVVLPDKSQYKGGGGYRGKSPEEIAGMELGNALNVAGVLLTSPLTNDVFKDLVPFVHHHLSEILQRQRQSMADKGIVAPTPQNATASPVVNPGDIPTFKTGMEYLKWLRDETGIEYQKQLELNGFDTINKVKDWQAFAKKVISEKSK